MKNLKADIAKLLDVNFEDVTPKLIKKRGLIKTSTDARKRDFWQEALENIKDECKNDQKYLLLQLEARIKEINQSITKEAPNANNFNLSNDIELLEAIVDLVQKANATNQAYLMLENILKKKYFEQDDQDFPVMYAMVKFLKKRVDKDNFKGILGLLDIVGEK